MQTILLVGVSLLGSGCFVFDEIDKGQALMEHHSPAGKQKSVDPGAAKEKAAAGGGLSLAALREKGAGVFSDLSGRVEEALKKTPDPEDVVVSCRIEGRVEFTRKFDCQSRGGRVASR